jgi:hypothetical protein
MNINTKQFVSSIPTKTNVLIYTRLLSFNEEWCVLGCYAMWLL